MGMGFIEAVISHSNKNNFEIELRFGESQRHSKTLIKSVSYVPHIWRYRFVSKCFYYTIPRIH